VKSEFCCAADCGGICFYFSRLSWPNYRDGVLLKAHVCKDAELMHTDVDDFDERKAYKCLLRYVGVTYTTSAADACPDECDGSSPSESSQMVFPLSVCVVPCTLSSVTAATRITTVPAVNCSAYIMDGAVSVV